MSGHEQVNILLVDDQQAKLISYEVILDGLGENLLKAHSAREACEILLKEDVAVVLVDVCMPELDGFELAKMIREHPRFEKTAIIFISAIHLSDIDRIRGYESGAVDYVPVPVVPEILRAKVRIFVELWRKTRQLEKLNDELDQRVRARTAELEASALKLGETAERLRLASEAAGFGTYDYAPAGLHVFWSSYLRDMVGLAGEDRLKVDDVLAVVHPDHRELVREHIALPARQLGRRELEFKVVRADGEVRWLLDRGQIVSGSTARQKRVMGTIVDITERKRAEERQQLLLAELDHRVKNILGNVSAIARLSRRRAKSVEEFVQTLDGRIQAIALAHGLLRKGTWDGMELSQFASAALAPFAASGNISISGDPLRIVPEVAQSLALILHELATNAVKHGALSTASGAVALTWGRTSTGHTRITWQESGGPGVSPPDARGFGLTVLQTAAADLGAVATCDFRKEGFFYTLQGQLEANPQRAVILPFVANESIVESRPADIPRSGLRVLVVEDEALVALQLQKDLEDCGYEVVGPARSLKHGLLLAKQENFDFALLDVSLAREMSSEIADHLISRHIPFALATGYSDLMMLPPHLRSAPRLSKPYLAEDIRRCLGGLRAAARHENQAVRE